MSHVLNGFPCFLKTGRLTRAGFGGARLRVASDRPLLLAASAESANAGSLQRGSVVASFAGAHGSRKGREVGSDWEAPLSPSPLYPLQPKTGRRFYVKLGFSMFGTHASSLLGPGHEGTWLCGSRCWRDLGLPQSRPRGLGAADRPAWWALVGTALLEAPHGHLRGGGTPFEMLLLTCWCLPLEAACQWPPVSLFITFSL